MGALLNGAKVKNGQKSDGSLAAYTAEFGNDPNAAALGAEAYLVGKGDKMNTARRNAGPSTVADYVKAYQALPPSARAIVLATMESIADSTRTIVASMKEIDKKATAGK